MTVRSTAAHSLQSRSTRLIRAFAADERGGTAIEYSLLASLIAVACVGAMKGLGNTTTNTWNGVSNQIGNAMK